MGKINYARAGNHPGVLFLSLPQRVYYMADSENTFANLVDNAISNNPHLPRRTLRIETEDGRVVLLGTVGSYYQKQMAQEAVRRIQGVRAIDNRLTVLA